MSSEKILVIGATGNNGFRVAKNLLEQKRSVLVAARSPNKQSAELKSLGAEVVEFDFAKPESVAAAVKGVHSIFLLTPFVENDLKLNELVIDAAKAAGVKFILRFSAAGADEKSTQRVVKSHGLADAYLKASGIDYAIITPTFFFTNYEWQAGSIKAQGVILGSSGTSKFNGIHPDDIADVSSAILLNPSEHKGQTYHLTGSSADVRSGEEIAALIGASIGKEVKYVDLAPEAYQATLQKYGQPEWQASDVTFLEQVKRNNWAAHTSDSVKKITGKEPRSFASWLAGARHLFGEEKKESSGGRILVLGATGTNGTRLTRGLLAKKKKVVVGVRDPASKQAEEYKKQGAEVVEFNYDKPATVEAAVQNISQLFLLVPLVENSIPYNNATIDAAKKAGVKFIVRLSAIGADAKSSAHISKEHGVSDDYLKASGVDYSILLPTFFTTNFLRTGIKQAGVFNGASGGNAKYTIVDPDDIADVTIEILSNPDKHKNTSYTLTGAEPLTDNEIAHLFTTTLGKEVKYIDQTPEAFGAQLSKYGLPKWQVEDLVFLQHVKKNGWAATSNDTIKQILGREPRSFAQWLSANKNAFLEEKKESGGEGRILVLGATGTNGTRVARGLLEKKQKVVVGVRSPDSKQAEEFKKQGAEVVEFNFDKPDTVKSAFTNIHSVFLVVPLVEKSVPLHNSAVDAAKAAGVKFIVSLSAGGADSKSQAHLPREHGESDDYLKASGISYSLLLPTFFYTNWLHQADRIKNQSIITGASGDSKFSVIDPDDIADVAISILLNPTKHHNTSYHLTGYLVKDSEVAGYFGSVLGKEVKYIDSSLEDFNATLSKFGVPKWLADDFTFLETVKRSGWATALTNTVKEITGQEPRTLQSWIASNKAAFS